MTVKKINYVEMCYICGDCGKDCKTAHKDGSCTLAGDSKEEAQEHTLLRG